MCGRVTQEDLDDMLSDFSWAEDALRRSTAAPCWNVAPTMRRPVAHVQGEGYTISDLHWGYQAPWAVGKVPMAINTRMDKITGRYWASLLKRGRVIVPVNGWYEWTEEEGVKQPWHIHRADRRLLYFAGLAGFGPEAEKPAANGFTIITDDARGGMIDIHDRRPIVFTAADAATWLDPATSPELAEQLARECALGPEYFAWYRVDRAVGNVRNQGPHLAQPI